MPRPISAEDITADFADSHLPTILREILTRLEKLERDLAYRSDRG